MKRFSFIFILIIAAFSIFVLTACTKEEKKDNKEEKEVNNTAFGKYTGIYKLDDCEFKVLHNDDMISLLIEKDGDSFGNDMVSIEGSKVETDNYDLEFTNNSVKVKSSNEEVPSGEYKKSSYSTDDIYKDYIGEVSLYDNNYNGKFETEKNTIYTVQTSEDELKILFKNDEETVNIILYKKDKDHFYEKFFDDKYDLVFDKDTAKLTITYGNKKKSSMDGTYTRKAKLTKEEIIKLFNE